MHPNTLSLIGSESLKCAKQRLKELQEKELANTVGSVRETLEEHKKRLKELRLEPAATESAKDKLKAAAAADEDAQGEKEQGERSQAAELLPF